MGVSHASILSVFFNVLVYFFRFWFRFGSLMSLSLSVLSFGFGLVRFSWFFGCVCDNIYASIASSHFRRHQEVPPNATQKLPHKRQGDGNFASGRGVWEPKFQPMVAETHRKRESRIRRGFFLGRKTSAPLVVAGEIHGDVWGCFLFGKIKVSDGFLGTTAQWYVFKVIFK